MASNFLRGLAVVAGTGLVIGFGGILRRRATPMSKLSSNFPTLKPLMERLDRIEARLGAAEAARPEIDLRIEKQAEDIEALQVQLSETGQRVAAEATMVELRFAEITREVPAILESMLVPHVENLRAGLRAEMLESVEATLTTFGQSVENKVSLRISTLEKSLIDQSTVISTLSQRAVESDAQFQRLISAVERLCERNGPAMPDADKMRHRVPFARV
jgi:hypothetical protein